MSHKLFRHSILSDARVWDFLKQVDAAEAQRCREAGCPRCGSALHSATYPRKPHGLAAALRDDVRRFSLCCSVCRRRVKPAVGAFLRPAVLRRGAVRCGERAGCGRRRAVADDRTAMGDPVIDTEALAALVAGSLPADPAVAGEAGRAGGAARRGAAALGAAHHAGPELALAGAAQLGLADAVDRCLRARRRSGIARRKRFCHAPIGRRIIATSTKQRGGMAQ